MAATGFEPPSFSDMWLVPYTAELLRRGRFKIRGNKSEFMKPIFLLNSFSVKSLQHMIIKAFLIFGWLKVKSGQIAHVCSKPQITCGNCGRGVLVYNLVKKASVVIDPPLYYVALAWPQIKGWA